MFVSVSEYSEMRTHLFTHILAGFVVFVCLLGSTFFSDGDPKLASWWGSIGAVAIPQILATSDNDA